MKKVQLAALVVAIVLGAFGLAACGDSDSNQDEDDITAAIDRAATSGDPAACTEVQTQKFLEQTNGGGGDVVKECEKDASDSVADSVDVTNIEVDGDTATADAAVTGSFFDGQTLDIALVKEGDQWKLDEFKGFVDFDRDTFVASLGKALAEDPSSPAGIEDCIKTQAATLSDDQLESIFTSSDDSAGDKLFGPCFQGQ